MSQTLLVEKKSYVDIMRGIGILLVVFGHITRSEQSLEFVYNFHMPLFFFISGLLFNPQKYISVSVFLQKRFNSLILPYVFFYLITLLFYFFVEKSFRSATTQSVTPIQHILGLFYGTDINGFMNHNSPLWFLPCLFSTELIFSLLSFKIKNIKILFLSVFSLLMFGLFLYHKEINWMPWGINIALIALFFYFIGYVSKNIVENMNKNKRNYNIVFITIILFAHIALFYYLTNGRVNMLHGMYGENFFSFLILSISGILLVLFLSLMLKKQNILEWIGNSSACIVILAFHGIMQRILMKLFVLLSGIPINSLRENLFFTLFLTILVVLSIVPFVLFYKKYILIYFVPKKTKVTV